MQNVDLFKKLWMDEDEFPWDVIMSLLNYKSHKLNIEL